MKNKMSTFFISAGEPSGDLHAAKLVLSLKNASPQTLTALVMEEIKWLRQG